MQKQMPNNDYLYYQATGSICDVCLKKIDAKIIIENNSVFIKKYCPEHGWQKHILEEDAQYHLKKVLYDKPSTSHECESEIVNGCPYDCGLCVNHEQHTCIGLIEITQACNISCPLCYASCDGEGADLDLDTIERMLDFYIESEGGRAEILQISGGEPTLHKDINEILRMCKRKNIGHVMLNTNGIKLAEDEEFARGLAPLKGGFEIYLQFDSMGDAVYEKVRNMKMLEIKKKAIDNLNRYDIPTTLVCTVIKGMNDEEMPDIINYGLNTSCVRGVNFQPAARFGGYEDACEDSLTVSGIISRIEKSSGGLLKTADFVPLPCNVERVAVTYLYKKGKSFIPITREKNIEKYVPYINNTFLFTIEDSLAQGQAPVFGFCRCLDFLNDFKKVVPKNFLLWDMADRVKYLNENTFRITVSSFIDRFNFDMKSMQKECVHVITKELKRIPFSAYNMIHRKTGG
ncbi:MAG: radical SAM protein [Saccharofermentanales bacterium]